MIIKEKVENERNTDISMGFSINGTLLNHSLLTRMQVYAGGTIIDSSINPELFDFTRNDRVTIKMGQAGLVVGRYLCRIYLFDTVNTLGRPWDNDTLEIEVA